DLSHVQALVAQVKPEIYYQIGMYHLERQNVDLSLQYLKKSHELYPGRWQTHMALGRVYMEKEMDKDAIGEFQEVLRLAPEESAQAYEMLGEVFVRQGRSPHTTMVWFQHAGEFYLKKGQIDDAIRTYDRILALDPNNRDILNHLGELYIKQGAKDRAVQIYLTLAQMYEPEGVLDKIIQLYETIIGLDPHNEGARNKLISIYQGIVERDPTNVSMRMKLIDSLLARGMAQEAVKHYFALAQSHLERGMLDDAVKVTRKLLEIDPNNIQAREILADVYLKKDMQNEALDMWQQVVKIHRARGDEKSALEVQQRLIQVFPQASELIYQVALALRERGDFQGALTELDRILAERPQDMRAHIYRSECLRALNRIPEAIQAYAQILTADPYNVEVRKNLIDTLIHIGRLDDASIQIDQLAQLKVPEPERLAYRHRVLALYLERNAVDRVEAELHKIPDEDEQKLVLRKELVKKYLDADNLEKAFEGLPAIPRSDRERNRLVTRMLEIPLGRGDLETAAAAIYRLPEDDPLRLSFQRRLVGSYLDAGRLAEGAAECSRLPENDESRPGFTQRLIASFLAAGQLDDATREIYRLAEGDPLRTSFMGQLIEAYLSAGDLDRAAQEVARLDVEDEIRPQYRRRIIQAYLNAGRFDEAERDIFALEDDDPEKRSFLRMLAQKFLTLGDFERMREIVMKMPDDMEEKHEYLDNLMHNYLNQGDLIRARTQIYHMAESVSAQGNHQEAERLYREILAYYPGDVEIRLRLSQEIAAQGELERAREGMLVLAGRFHREGNATSAADIYTRILDLEPKNLNARYKLGSLWAQQGQTAQALEQFSTLARVYLEQNLPEVAQRVLYRILKLDPKDIEHRREMIRLLIRNLRFDDATKHYRVLMGIYLERGEVDEALNCVREIINLQPLNLELRQSLGLMFLKAGFLEQGQGLLEELVQNYKDKNDTDRQLKVLLTLVESFEENEQWQSSLEYRERVADLLRDSEQWPRAQQEYLHILQGYLQRGHRDNADPVFVKLIDGSFRNRTVPEAINLLEGLGESLVEADRPALALVIKERLAGIMERLDEWDRALELVEAVSQDYLEMGDIEQALSFRRRAADLALAHDRVAQGIEHLFHLAQSLVELRGFEAARPVLDELHRTAAEDVGFLERVGDVLFSQGLFEEARPIYHEVLEMEPGRPLALSRIAIIYAREGRLEEAADVAKQIFAKGLVPMIIEEYKRATGYKPNDPGSHIRLGQFYQQLGFLEEAIGEFQAAARDPGRLLVACNQLALCFSQQGYRGLAIRQLQRALDLPGYEEEDLLETRFNLANALEEGGQYMEALGAFQECYAVDIRYRDVAQRIERLMERMQAAEADSAPAEASEEEPEE
ncbi:MAG: tetratricopeptide repeat protein, partial [Candidatus Eremiobacterota bacterium]